MRDTMRRLNGFLARADIAFIHDGAVPFVDPYDRRLRRHFNVTGEDQIRFDQNGRLFGGFWMNMKSDRRQNIRIDGEPVVTLDYGSMFTRLAYSHLNATPPGGDLYVVPGLEGYRSGVKLAMNVLLFDSARRNAWPAEMIGLLPDDWTVSRTKAAILKRHKPLREVWGKALGFSLMYQESEVLLSVLQDLMEQGVTALPLHDGLIVSQSSHAVAIESMGRSALALTGLEIPVSCKT
jgi:hypothetical protein